jgi:hypothetical protein
MDPALTQTVLAVATRTPVVGHPRDSPDSAIRCSDLLNRGDAAARECDVDDLRLVALALSGGVGDPLADRLRQLARTCHEDPATSFAAWHALRGVIALRVTLAGT